jgi:hypothetical protein
MDFKGNDYAKGLFQIVTITLIVATATVALHEFGHFMAGSAAGCKDIKINFLDNEFNAYTEMRCPTTMGQEIALSGFLLVIPFAGLLWLTRNQRYYSLVVLGLNLIISYSDISLISQQAMNISAAAGIMIIFFGGNLLVNSHFLKMEAAALFSSYEKRLGYK